MEKNEKYTHKVTSGVIGDTEHLVALKVNAGGLSKLSSREEKHSEQAKHYLLPAQQFDVVFTIDCHSGCQLIQCKNGDLSSVIAPLHLRVSNVECSGH